MQNLLYGDLKNMLSFITEMPWPDKMIEFSGFTIEDISRCAFHMHEKW